MRIFWFCDDCLWAAAYDDYSGLDLEYSAEEVEHRYQAIHNGLQALGPLSANFDVEHGWGVMTFSRIPCDCCRSPLHGARHRFTRL